MITTRSHCLLFHKRYTDWDSPLGYKQVISHCTRRISLLLTLVLDFTSDSCNNNDILLIVGYNYNVTVHFTYLQCELSSSQLRADLDKCIKNSMKSHEHPLKHTRVCVITYAFASAMTTPVERQPQSSVLSTVSSD